MNGLHGNIEADGLAVKRRPNSGGTSATGSILADLRGFSSSEIVITRDGTGAYTTANSVYFYARHSNTLGAAQVKVPASDLVFDLVGTAGISGAYSSDTASTGATGRIYTLRTTFKNLTNPGVYPTGYQAGSVTLALNTVKVGYKGTRRYLRVGFVASGAAGTTTGAYGNVGITIVKGRPAIAPVPVSKLA